MASINGTTCNIKVVDISIIHRNRSISIVGSNNNPVEDYGFEGLSITISGVEYSQSDYDDVIAEFMKTGKQILIIRSDWEYRVHSARLNQVGKDGYADDKYYPYSLTMKTRTPFQYSTTDISRPKTITSNNQEWSADNSANNISTAGTVDTPVDIEITASSTSATAQETISQTESY